MHGNRVGGDAAMCQRTIDREAMRMRRGNIRADAMRGGAVVIHSSSHNMSTGRDQSGRVLVVVNRVTIYVTRGLMLNRLRELRSDWDRQLLILRKLTNSIVLDGTQRPLLASGDGDAVLIRGRRKWVGPTMFVETTLIKPRRVGVLVFVKLRHRLSISGCPQRCRRKALLAHLGAGELRGLTGAVVCWRSFCRRRDGRRAPVAIAHP
jgi:hypothetical protein